MNHRNQIGKFLPLYVLAISIIVYILAIYAPLFTSTVYSRGFYRLVSQSVSCIVSFFPFSLAELIILLLPLCICYFLIKGAYLLLFRRARARSFWRRFGITMLKSSCYVLSAFILFAGVNYRRVPLADRMGLEVASASEEELMQLCRYLMDETNELAMQTTRTKEGKFVPAHSFAEAKKRIAAAYDSLSMQYPDFKGYYPSSKPLLFSHYVSYAHIMGFFFPFTFESNINKDIPEFMVPAVMAHEQAHLRGLMREEEAEFSVYLLSRHTLDIDLKYSCNLSIFIRAITALYKVNKEGYASLPEAFSAPLQRDLHDYSAYWNAFRSPVGEISKTINDAYLKANSQSDGVQSYGRVVDLLIAAHKHLQTIKNQDDENN